MAKPKIWAHCAAGCEWETVHKEDFDTYRQMASRFPLPTENTEKKLPEAGYYHIKVKPSGVSDMVEMADFGIIYWDGEKVTNTPLSILSNHEITSNSDVVCLCIQGFCKIGSDGSLNLYSHMCTGTQSALHNYTANSKFYTSQIKDVIIPESAEEESY